LGKTPLGGQKKGLLFFFPKTFLGANFLKKEINGKPKNA